MNRTLLRRAGLDAAWGPCLALRAIGGVLSEVWPARFGQAMRQD